MKRIHLYLLAAGLLSASLACSSDEHTTATPPNIIFIMADDLGYGDLGSYGQEK